MKAFFMKYKPTEGQLCQELWIASINMKDGMNNNTMIIVVYGVVVLQSYRSVRLPY